MVVGGVSTLGAGVVLSSVGGGGVPASGAGGVPAAVGGGVDLLGLVFACKVFSWMLK